VAEGGGRRRGRGRRLLALALTGAALLLAAALQAPAAEQPRRYLGAGALASRAGLDLAFWQDGSVTGAALDREGRGWLVYGGLPLGRYLGLELSWLDLGRTRFTGVSDGFESIWLAGPVRGETVMQGLALELLPRLPLGRLGALYLHGGLFAWDSSARYYDALIGPLRLNRSGLSGIWGAGLELHLRRRWALRLQAGRAGVGLAGIEFVQVDHAALSLLRRL